MDDREIVSLFFARDEGAIRACEAAYGRYCMGISMGILASEADAEECVNDTWLRAWQSIPPTDPPSLKAYLGRIVRNLSISRYRERHRHKRNADLEVSLSELEDCIPMREEQAGELLPLLERFLRGCDPLDRRLFVGRYWHNYTARTLGEANGLTANAVSLRLLRVRERLKEFLEKEGYHL